MKKVILVVDDEEQMVDYIETVLKRSGYDTVSFLDPVKALAFFTENAERVDLILSDITMPGMDGMELAQRVSRIRGDVAVILMSGYSDRLFGAASLPNIKAVLDKPVLKADLMEEVEKVVWVSTR